MPKTSKTDIERLIAKVRVDEAGCWIWTASTDPNGYAVFTLGGKKVGGHVAAYRLLIGPVPVGLQLDHEICDTKRCVNPWHLVPKTGRANTLRCPTAPAAINARRTHCAADHPLSGPNLYVTPDGRRQCRACQKERERRHRRRRRSS